MGSTKGILISREDLDFILGERKDDFDYSIQHCYCGQCSKDYTTEIINYSIRLTDLFDISLNGYCKVCGRNMGRHLEFGEDPVFAERARAFLATKKLLKESHIKSASKPVRSVAEPSKREKKLLREILEKGMQKEYTTGIEKLENIIKQWREQQGDNGETYKQLFQELVEYDKHLAERYDYLSGSRYAQIVAGQLADGIIDETDLQQLPDAMQQQIIGWSNHLKGE